MRKEYRIESLKCEVLRKKATRPYSVAILYDKKDGTTGAFTMTTGRALKIEKWMTEYKNVRIEKVVAIEI